MGNMRTMIILVIWVMAALGDASRRRLHSWERNRLGWPRSRSPSGAGSSGRAVIAGRHVSSTSSEAENDDDTVVPGTSTEGHAWLALTTQPQAASTSSVVPAVGAATHEESPPGTAMPALPADVASRLEALSQNMQETIHRMVSSWAQTALLTVSVDEEGEGGWRNQGWEADPRPLTGQASLNLADLMFLVRQRLMDGVPAGLLDVAMSRLNQLVRAPDTIMDPLRPTLLLEHRVGATVEGEATSTMEARLGYGGYDSPAAAHTPDPDAEQTEIVRVESEAASAGVKGDEAEASTANDGGKELALEQAPPMSTLSGSRAPATPPVPGPNPWMALVEATARDEEADDSETETAFCAAHPAIAMRAAEAETSSSAGPAANDGPAALLRQVGPGAGPPFLAQPRQPVLFTLKDCLLTLELEGLTSLGRARALIQRISLAVSSIHVMYRWSSKPAQAGPLEIEGSSSLITANCCRPCTSLLIVCHNDTLSTLSRYLPSMWIPLRIVAALGMSGCPPDQGSECHPTNSILLSGQAYMPNKKGNDPADLAVRCCLKSLPCSVLTDPRVSGCGKKPSYATYGTHIAAYAWTGLSISLAEGPPSPGRCDHRSRLAIRCSDRCAWAWLYLASIYNVWMQYMLNFSCLNSCHALPPAWMFGASASTFCAGAPPSPWPELRGCNPLDLVYYNRGCQCIGRYTDQASVRCCFDWLVHSGCIVAATIKAHCDHPVNKSLVHVDKARRLRKWPARSVCTTNHPGRVRTWELRDSEVPRRSRTCLTGPSACIRILASGLLHFLCHGIEGSASPAELLVSPKVLLSTSREQLMPQPVLESWGAQATDTGGIGGCSVHQCSAAAANGIDPKVNLWFMSCLVPQGCGPWSPSLIAILHARLSNASIFSQCMSSLPAAYRIYLTVHEWQCLLLSTQGQCVVMPQAHRFVPGSQCPRGHQGPRTVCLHDTTYRPPQSKRGFGTVCPERCEVLQPVTPQGEYKASPPSHPRCEMPLPGTPLGGERVYQAGRSHPGRHGQAMPADGHSDGRTPFVNEPVHVNRYPTEHRESKADEQMRSVAPDDLANDGVSELEALTDDALLTTDSEFEDPRVVLTFPPKRTLASWLTIYTSRAMKELQMEGHLHVGQVFPTSALHPLPAPSLAPRLANPPRRGLASWMTIYTTRALQELQLKGSLPQGSACPTMALYPLPVPTVALRLTCGPRRKAAAKMLVRSGLRCRRCYGRRSDCVCRNVLPGVHADGRFWLRKACAFLNSGMQKWVHLNWRCRGPATSIHWLRGPKILTHQVTLYISPVRSAGHLCNQHCNRFGLGPSLGLRVLGVSWSLQRCVCSRGRRDWQIRVAGTAVLSSRGTEGISSSVWVLCTYRRASLRPEVAQPLVNSGLRSWLYCNRRSDCKCLNILRRLCNAVWMQPCASSRLGQQRCASWHWHCLLESQHSYNEGNHQSRDAQPRGQDPSRSRTREPAFAWVRVTLCAGPDWGGACSRNQQDDRPSLWTAWGSQVSGAIFALYAGVCVILADAYGRSLSRGQRQKSTVGLRASPRLCGAPRHAHISFSCSTRYSMLSCC